MSNFGFNSDLLISILLVAGSFLLALILELIGDFVFKAGKNKNATLLYRVAYNLKGPWVVFFIVSGFLWSLSLLDIVAGDLVLEGSDRKWLNDSLLTTWGVLVIVILTISFSRIASVFLDWYSRNILKKTTTELDDKLVPPLKRILPIIIYVLGALQLLGYFGFSISPILAGLGIGGIAVALAVQPMLSNFFAGTYVLTEGALKEGDFIEIEGGIAGYVASVGWRSTKIRDRFNNLVLIPNSKMAESVVTNFYSPETAINILITSGVAYEENLENVEVTVKDTLQQLSSVSENVANNTQPRFGFSEFGDSNINFWIFMQAKDWSASFQLKSEIIKAVHSSFAQKGITINYPTRRIIQD